MEESHEDLETSLGSIAAIKNPFIKDTHPSWDEFATRKPSTRYRKPSNANRASLRKPSMGLEGITKIIEE